MKLHEQKWTSRDFIDITDTDSNVLKDKDRELPFLTDWSIYPEQMDAEGFGSQTAADTPRRPPTTPEKQTLSTVTASHSMLRLQALSSSLHAGTAKRGHLGRRRSFWVTSGSLSPETAASMYTFRVFLNLGFANLGPSGPKLEKEKKRENGVGKGSK